MHQYLLVSKSVIDTLNDLVMVKIKYMCHKKTEATYFCNKICLDI